MVVYLFLHWQYPSDGDFSFPRFVGLFIPSLWFSFQRDSISFIVHCQLVVYHCWSWLHRRHSVWVKSGEISPVKRNTHRRARRGRRWQTISRRFPPLRGEYQSAPGTDQCRHRLPPLPDVDSLAPAITIPVHQEGAASCSPCRLALPGDDRVISSSWLSRPYSLRCWRRAARVLLSRSLGSSVSEEISQMESLRNTVDPRRQLMWLNPLTAASLGVKRFRVLNTTINNI
jgi:hypothetical protein